MNHDVRFLVEKLSKLTNNVAFFELDLTHNEVTD